ncbi:dihydroflavonol-4-reductase [Flavobacterium sp. 28YEA47A]|uniref:NAD-dependent epimerase/dehydratase family protein n=1 Tax=Flavobacterium sp. 28YEA47A TaxID=3156276 RepID=UPI0035145C7F
MVLVTGATGLVGSHLLLLLLENGEEVKALYRNEKNIQQTKALFEWKDQLALFEKINWIQGCLTDIPSLEKAFENIDYVYHCAAFISFDPDDEEQLRKTNIEGTANIVNLCLAYHVKKLCYVSSIAALGDLQGRETVITEETEWNPEIARSDYAISKFGAEMEVWRGQQEGLPVAIVNPGIILGPGFWNSGSSEIFQRIKKGLKYYTEGSTGFVTVEDVTRSMYQLMKSNIQKERFILVTQSITYHRLADLIATALDKQKPSVYLKPWVTGLAWRIDWLISTLFFKKRMLSKATAISLHTQSEFDNSKIKNALNFEFEDIANYISKVAVTV